MIWRQNKSTVAGTQWFLNLQLQREKRDAGPLLAPPAFDAAGSVDLPGVLEDGLHELAQQAVHVALAARKQALQEGDVAAVDRQQQRHVGQSPNGSQREGCSGAGVNLFFSSRIMKFND